MENKEITLMKTNKLSMSERVVIGGVGLLVVIPATLAAWTFAAAGIATIMATTLILPQK